MKNILIADDDQEDLELFEIALQDTCKEYRLHKALNGIELLELLEKIDNPHMVVLDINMPKMSGIECLRWIRQNKKTADLHVLILSTSDSEKDMQACMAAGANYYLIKPYSFSDLKKITAKICCDTLEEAIINETIPGSKHNAFI